MLQAELLDTNDSVAVEVVGDSMLPIDEGWLLFTHAAMTVYPRNASANFAWCNWQITGIDT